jgi:hypothetical protein
MFVNNLLLAIIFAIANCPRAGVFDDESTSISGSLDNYDDYFG